MHPHRKIAPCHKPIFDEGYAIAGHACSTILLTNPLASFSPTCRQSIHIHLPAVTRIYILLSHGKRQVRPSLRCVTCPMKRASSETSSSDPCDPRVVRQRRFCSSREETLDIRIRAGLDEIAHAQAVARDKQVQVLVGLDLKGEPACFF